jgi:AraC-like DNA-binding protein
MRGRDAKRRRHVIDGCGALRQRAWHCATSSPLSSARPPAYRERVGDLLTTDAVDPRDRATYWREVMCRTFIRLDVTQRVPERFSGALSTEHAGPVKITRIRTDPMQALRTRALLRAADEEQCLVAVQLTGRTVGRQDDRVADLAPGDLALFDSVRPYGVDFQGTGFDHLVVQFPRHLLTRRGVVVERATATAIRGRSNLGRIAYPLVLSVARAAGTASADTNERLGTILLDTLATAFGTTPRPSETADEHTLLLERVRLYVHAHLGDPQLDPAAAAATANISVRQLHRLFENQGATFSRWVRAERLRRCYDDLADDAHHGTRIEILARRWGFRDLPTLSKAFRAEYGCSPREHRNQSRGRT